MCRKGAWVELTVQVTWEAAFMICDDFFYVRCAQGKINLREKMVYGAWAKEEDRRGITE